MKDHEFWNLMMRVENLEKRCNHAPSEMSPSLQETKARICELESQLSDANRDVRVAAAGHASVLHALRAARARIKALEDAISVLADVVSPKGETKE